MECLPSRASSSLLGSCQQAVGSVRPMLRSDRHVARPAPGGSSRGSHCGGGAPPSPRHARLPALAAMVPNGYGGEPDAKAAQRRTIMMNYVSACSPNDVKTFVDTAPRPVVAAMRQTVANIVGSLPSAYFEVKVSTMAESLSQLFLTMARTGYLFASAQCRMELQATLNSSGSDSNMGDAAAAAAAAVASSTSSLSPASSAASAVSSTLSSVIVLTQSSDSAPSSSSSSSSGDSERAGSMSLSRRESGEASTSGRSVILLPGEEQYAPGVQKRNLEGEVLRWSYEKGVERLAAAEYVEHLEQQVATLKEMLLQVHEAHQQQQQQGGQAKLGSGSSGCSDGGAVRAAAAPAAAAAAAFRPPPPPPSLLSSVPSAATAAAAAAAAAATGSGELLEFLRGLPGDSLGELTSNMCPEVLDAMDAFVARLMGTSDKEQLRSMSSEFDGVELSKVLLWLLVVGYALRTAEMRLETLSFSGDAGQVPEGGLFGMKMTQQKKGPWDFGSWGKLLPGGK